jgi:hypothetical protein
MSSGKCGLSSTAQTSHAATEIALLHDGQSIAVGLFAFQSGLRLQRFPIILCQKSLECVDT